MQDDIYSITIHFNWNAIDGAEGYEVCEEIKPKNASNDSICDILSDGRNESILHRDGSDDWPPTKEGAIHRKPTNKKSIGF